MKRTVEEILKLEVDPAFKRRAGWIGAAVKKEAAKKRGLRILEIGCGRGFYEHLVSELCPGVEITGVDTNERYLAVAKKGTRRTNVNFLKADGRKLPFKDGSFEMVICTEVLEHVDNDREVIGEAARVTNSGGLLVVTVPNNNYPLAWDPINWILERVLGRHVPANIWWLAGIWADHIRLYDEEELVKKLTDGGWSVERIERGTRYCAPFSHFLLYGLGKNLVERGLFEEMNRFNYRGKISGMAKWVMKYFEWWDRKNYELKSKSGEPAVNLGIWGRRK